jgi:hypothetical protein
LLFSADLNEQLWDLGLVDQFNSNIKYLAAERYPTDNCAAIWGGGTPANPQDELPNVCDMP